MIINSTSVYGHLRDFTILFTGSKRFICTTLHLGTVFDKRTWVEPIEDMEELAKPLAQDDIRRQRYIKPMKNYTIPVYYRNHIVDKMIRVMMMRSDKELIRTLVYDALELVKRIQYEKWLEEEDEEKRNKIILDPFVIAEKAILNCRPVMELKKVVKAGTLYYVPSPMSEHLATFRAMKMMRTIIREKCKHGKNRFSKLLAHELINAMNNEGFTIQAKQELHQLCENNRAYSAYRHA